MEDTSPLLVKIITEQLLEISRVQAAQGVAITRSAALLEELVGTAVNPGRLPKLERHVDELREDHNKMKGVGIAWGAFISLILAGVAYFKGH